MKKRVLALVLFIFYGKSIFGCEEFQNLYLNYSNLPMFTIDKWEEAKAAKKKCLDKSFDSQYEELKAKRLETVKKFKRLGAKDEGGIPIDYLITELSETKKNTAPIRTPERTPERNLRPNTEISFTNKNCVTKTIANDAVNFSNTRNQDSIGWCYAFAAADMLSFKLNTRFSAISFVDTVKNTIKDQILDRTKQGSDVKVSMTQTFSKLKGLCLESSLSSTDFEFCEFKNISGVFNYLITPNKIQNQCQYDDINKIFPNFDFNEFNRLSEDLKTVYIENLIKLHCAKDLYKLNNLPQLIYKYTQQYKIEDIFNEIEKQLDLGMPSAIAYNVRKLQGLQASEEHASLIMGRATNPETNECEYLVRNSWGKSCLADEGSNPNGIRCHTENGRYTGYFYVNREKLKEFTSGVYYFK